MMPGHDQIHIPFSIPIWGVVEGTHIHVNSHLNFVFHALQGSLMAVAAYPLRDQFHFLDKKGDSILSFLFIVKKKARKNKAALFLCTDKSSFLMEKRFRI